MNFNCSCFFQFLILFYFASIFPKSAFAQNDVLFSNENPLQIKIKTNLDLLFRDKSEDSKKQKADFYYKNDEGDWVYFPITLKLRGNFRRKNCDFPPIQLNFSKSGIKDKLFSDQKKIKMVTTCTEQEFLLKEYLVYKSYNLLTDFSFRVRLLKVKFINTGKIQKNETGYAFLIEDIDLVAKRNNAKEFESENPQLKPTKSDFYNTLFMFNYMVGNSDFLFSSNHNLKVIRFKDSKEKLIVPYDFDWCGFVDPGYKNRIQDGQLNIDLKTRTFRGYCLSKIELKKLIDHFNLMKPKFLALYSEFPYLKKKEESEVIAYVNEFYSFINSPKEVEAWMDDYCKSLEK